MSNIYWRNSPSLRGELGPMIEKLKPRVTRLATASLFGYGETVKEVPLPSYTEEQVLGDWFPEALPPPSPSPARGGGNESGRTRSSPGAS